MPTQHPTPDLAHKPDVRDLYTRYGPTIYRRCLFLLRSHSDAEDAMHDVFIKIVESYDQFRGESSPLTWVVKISTHHCLNVLRGRKALWHDRYEAMVEVLHQNPEAPKPERSELIQILLGKIDPKLQEAALYYFVDDMNQEEAAAACHCSIPTLRKRLRDFITQARRSLKNLDIEEVFGPMPL